MDCLAPPEEGDLLSGREPDLDIDELDVGLAVGDALAVGDLGADEEPDLESAGLPGDCEAFGDFAAVGDKEAFGDLVPETNIS